MSAKPDLRVCFIGDSYVAGAGADTGLGWVGRVTARARAEGYDLTAYNLGVRRDTAADAAARAPAELPCRLRLGDRFAAVIAVGTNDISLGAPLSQSLDALRRLIVCAEGSTAAALVVSPPPMWLAPDNDEVAKAMTEAFSGLCSDLSTPFLNLREAVTDWDLWLREAAAGDGAHPDGAGYALVADAVSSWPAWRTWLAGA